MKKQETKAKGEARKSEAGEMSERERRTITTCKRGNNYSQR